MPSRREFLEMEARSEAGQESARNWVEMDVDIDTDHAATGESQQNINHCSGQEASSHGQDLVGLLHAGARRGDAQRLASAYPSLHAPRPNALSMSASKMPVTTQPGHRFTENIDPSRAERADIHQKNLSCLPHNASSFGTKKGHQTSNSYTSARRPLQIAKLNDTFSSDPHLEKNTPEDPHSIHAHYPAALLQALDAGKLSFPGSVSSPTDPASQNPNNPL